ncbi:hypothetical protein [uncultured Flavonifractor sp.]|uniref:hypothetical protein n=1 Tax=uncultured Flavonifractor sp. TaxID=1193534 RepID=UPI002617B847|nr:hypothetical protein [uncultured Flavonifractor sp.]
MKQIYHFDRESPPVLREETLAAELERRRLRRQTALLALAGMLGLLCLLLTGAALYPLYPLLALACLFHLCAAVTGACVLTIVFVQKRREFTCCSR